MTLKQIFIRNLKEFRKKEGFSQMKLAEYCDTTTSYIGHIESGRKFPSMDMIEKIAKNLKIEPYLFFVNRAEHSPGAAESAYPKLPESMKNEIKSKIDQSTGKIISEILSNY
ncbi:MAG: helix-turn-helix transcriptional regulator [Treponema sp.]|nr:helix-turn-helix transcriptional regulator [Treponema sp.]